MYPCLNDPSGQVRFFSNRLLWETQSLRTVVWRCGHPLGYSRDKRFCTDGRLDVRGATMVPTRTPSFKVSLQCGKATLRDGFLF